MFSGKRAAEYFFLLCAGYSIIMTESYVFLIKLVSLVQLRWSNLCRYTKSEWDPIWWCYTCHMSVSHSCSSPLRSDVLIEPAGLAHLPLGPVHIQHNSKTQNYTIYVLLANSLDTLNEFIFLINTKMFWSKSGQRSLD